MYGRVLVVGGFAFALIGAVASSVYVPRIEADLTARSREALGAEGIGFDAVAFDGRDGTVTVFSTHARPSQAADVVAWVPGVRKAHVVVVEPPWKPPPPPRLDPWLRTTLSADFVELVGLLPREEDLQRVRAALSDALGGVTVRDAVTLGPADASAPWLDGYLAAVEAARGSTIDLSFEVREGRARLFGSVPDPAVRDAVVAAVDGKLGGLELDAELVVRRSATPGESP